MQQAKIAAGAAAIWALPLLLLAAHWGADLNYQYGFAAFPAAIFLLWKRWGTRPAPSRPAPRLAAAAWIGGAILSGAAWVVAQPNPDWRMVAWAMVAGASAMTLALFASAGGTRWLRHFLFPVAFVAAATPWPTLLESTLVSAFTDWVSAATAAALNAAGIPAIRSGALIELSHGKIGIDEACSGIRSFQATVAGALFLGELYRMRPAHRMLLLGAGALLALAGNILRATALAVAVVRGGDPAFAALHDPAGFWILSGVLAATWLLAARLPSRPEPLPEEGENRSPASPDALAAGSVAWTAAVALGTHLWFHPAAPAPGPAWRVVRPQTGGAVEPLPVGDTARAVLRFDEGEAFAWRDAAGFRFALYSFRWHPGPMRSRVLARAHRPEICLPATGYLPAIEPIPVSLAAGEIPIRFDASTYLDPGGGESLHVFYALAEDGAPGSAPAGNWSRMDGLRAVAQRRARVGQQVLEIIVAGPASLEEATVAVRRELARVILPPA